MNKKQSPSQKRGELPSQQYCSFVAAIAIVGTYTLGNSREARQNEEIARTEENETKDNITEDSADDAREADSAVIDNQNEDKTQGGAAGTGEAEKETAGGKFRRRWKCFRQWNRKQWSGRRRRAEHFRIRCEPKLW